jgi:hypothetical protein
MDKERNWVEEGAEVLLQLFQQFSKIAIPSDFWRTLFVVWPIGDFSIAHGFDNIR